MLHRHDAGDVFGAFSNQLRGMAHQFAALEGGYFAPDFEAALGRLDGFGEIGFGGERYQADLDLAGGIDDRLRVCGGAPGLVDIQVRIGIGGQGSVHRLITEVRRKWSSVASARMLMAARLPDEPGLQCQG